MIISSDILKLISEHKKPIDEIILPIKINPIHKPVVAKTTPIIEAPGNISFDVSISVFFT